MNNRTLSQAVVWHIPAIARLGKPMVNSMEMGCDNIQSVRSQLVTIVTIIMLVVSCDAHEVLASCCSLESPCGLYIWLVIWHYRLPGRFYVSINDFLYLVTIKRHYRMKLNNIPNKFNVVKTWINYDYLERWHISVKILKYRMILT